MSPMYMHLCTFLQSSLFHWGGKVDMPHLCFRPTTAKYFCCVCFLVFNCCADWRSAICLATSMHFPSSFSTTVHHFQHCTIAINKATLHLCGTLQVQVQYWHALKETMGRASEKFAARFDFNGHLILLANTSFPCSCASSSLPFSGKK